MEIINNMNPNKVKYFDLRDYISKIKVNTNVLEHMEETNKDFDEYMQKISNYDYDDLVHYWLIQAADELVNSSKIEQHHIDRQEYLKKNLQFDTLRISHQRIHDIHDFVMDNTKHITGYRNRPVHVSYIDKMGEEHIYWHAPEPEDVRKFMDTWIDIYKTKDLSVIMSNPFLKSALIKLLFIRIHPYMDGNGRTSRVLYNIKFTDSINKAYGRKLKLCPLNISASILINQFEYVNILDSIYFDLEHDNNEQMNKWFNYILNMVDEQLYFHTNHLDKLDRIDDAIACHRIDVDKFDQALKSILYDIRELDSAGIEEYKQKIIGTFKN